VLDYCESLSESTLEQCSDGVDNDNNRYIDCADYSCSRSEDEEVKSYCEARLENSFEKCHDRLDNDGNGFTDCADFSCSEFCQESLPGVNDKGMSLSADDRCHDGDDNDADGFVDCDDWDCSYNPEVNCEGPKVCE
jgi:hypothetical protein